ncbi:MAG: sensor histidine kinase [Gammaproteobacteria bacterium]
MPAEPVPDNTANLDTRVQIQRLVLLRWVSVAVMLVACWPLPAALGLGVPTGALLAVVLGMAAANFFTLGWLAGKQGEPAPRAPLAQLVLDLCGWSLFLYFTGGATNPLISMLLPLVAIGATVLPAAQAWLLAVLAVSAYSLLWGYYQPIELDDPALAATLHLAGMWLTFVLSAAVIVGFVVRMMDAIRARDRALAAAREEMARAAHIVALGNLAAGTAHNLGTPLGTMRIVIDDLLASPQTCGELREDLVLVHTQIDQCRQILSMLTAEAGARRAEGGRALAASTWINDVAGRWRVQRPGSTVVVRCDAALADTSLVADETLSQALHTLVNNAADASGEPVELNARIEDGALVLEVADRGPGLPAELRDTLGSAPRTERPTGMGIGLFLARDTLQRHGGRLEFSPRPGGGTVASLRIPLEKIEA